MNRFCWVMLAGLLAGVHVGAGTEPVPTNHPTATPAMKAPASPADQAFTAAQEALKKSDYPAGRRLFGDFAGKFPADARVPEAQFLKGMCELKGGPEGAALTTWNALVVMQPKSDAAGLALEQMALYYEKEGPPARVEELLNRLLTAFPTHAATVRLWTKRGDALFEAKKYAAAVQAWEAIEPQLSAAARQRLVVARALSQGAADSRGLLDAANTAVERNEPALAIGLYETIWKERSSLPEGQEARYRQGLCLVQEKKYAEAVAVWSELQRLLGTNAWKESAALEIAQTQAFKLKEYDTARGSYQAFLAAYPASASRLEAEYQLAGVLYLKQDFPSAKAQFESFIAAFPTNNPVLAEAKGYQAQCEAAVKAKEVASRKAVEAQKKAAATPKLTPTAQWLKDGDAALGRKDYRAAYTAYERIVLCYKLALEYEPAVYRAGMCLKEQGEFSKAQRLWEDFLRDKPRGAMADQILLALGDLCFEELEQPAAAQAAYQRLITEFPESKLSKEAHHRLGLALFRQGKWNTAKQIFEAQRIARGGPQPNAPPTELDRLIAACDAQRPLTPDRSRSLDKLAGAMATADLLFTAKEYAKAVRTYAKVVRTRPGSEEAAYSLLQAGRCYNQMREYQRALDCYEQFLDKYRNSQWADDALIRASVLYVYPLQREKQALDTLRLLIERYPSGNEADQALMHLATLASWKNKPREALQFCEQLVTTYPKSRFVPYITTVEIPSLTRRLPKEPAPSSIVRGTAP